MDDDMDDKDDTKRRTRNLSEKKRRDQFNMLVHELSTMISTNGRKMDKSTVLKSTINFLKNHNEITVQSRAHDVHEEWKPAFLSNEEFTYLILEAHEGFVMVFSSTGRICYVSESITSILGQNPAKIVNKSIFDYTCEEDRPILYNLLQRNVAATEQIQSVSKDKEMVMFELHLKRGALDFKDETTFELVTFNGHFRTNFEHLDGDDDSRHDMESSVLFVGTGRLHTPQLIRDVSLVDPNCGEFTSRHSLEWKFLFLDHRAPPIIGYLPFEVLGTSGYDYYHIDDLEKVVSCHEELMQKGELTSCYYRFLTKGQQWIWLQTRFYITYHQWNSKPEFVVCTHRVVSYPNIAKTTKEEVADTDNISDMGVSIKHTPSDEATLSNVSPSYMSEASDAFSVSYRTHSPVESRRRVLTEAMSEDTTTMPAMSPSYMSESSEQYGSSYRSHSQGGSKRKRLNDGAYCENAGMTPVSPSYMSEVNGSYNVYRTHSQKSTNYDTSWRRTRRYNAGSDAGSVSGDSHSSARHSCRQESHRGEQALVPQHGIGAQYLDPVPYVNVNVPAVLPMRAVPIIVTQDQAQIQEQLQKKHEELQEMIVRQQEELQHVKEQLLLARLGMLPSVSVPYANPEQLQQQQQITLQQRQITYENAPTYPQDPPPNNHGPHHASHASGPPHTLHNHGPHHPSHAPGPPHPPHNHGPHHPAQAPGPPHPPHNHGPHHPAQASGPPHPPHNHGPHHPAQAPGPPHPSHNHGPHHPAQAPGPPHPPHNHGTHHPAQAPGPPHPPHNQGPLPPPHNRDGSNNPQQGQGPHLMSQ